MAKKDYKPVEMHYIIQEERDHYDQLVKDGVLVVVSEHPTGDELKKLNEIFDHGEDWKR